MNRLSRFVVFFLLNFTIVWSQSPTITLDDDYDYNITYPYTVTGKYSLAVGDSLYFIRYYIGNDSTEVTDIDTINHTFTAIINNGNDDDGDYFYVFKLRSKNGIAVDTLHIHVDHTEPNAINFNVNNKYWSTAYPEFKVTVEFNEAIKINNGTTEIKLVSKGRRTIDIPYDKLSLEDRDTKLVIQVTKDLIQADSLEAWAGDIDLIIIKISDKYDNTLAELEFYKIIIADFVPPEVISFTPHYGHLSTIDTTLSFEVNFNEEIKENKSLIKIKKGELEFTPDNIEFNGEKVKFTLQLQNFRSDLNWNGDVEVIMQSFLDTADNSNEIDQNLLPRIYIDFVEPKVTQKFVSVDSVNKAFISKSENKISGLISFSEPVDTSKGFVLIKSQSKSAVEIKFKPIFENNNQNIKFLIDQKLLGDKGWASFQPKLLIYINEFEDTLGNKANLKRVGEVMIDIKEPEPPQIKNEIKSIVKEKKIFFEGTKEYKAKVYFNSEVLSEFTQDTVWSKYNIFLPNDGIYKFIFWQVDSLGNPSDTTIVRILADRQMPQFAGQGAQLQIGTNPRTNAPLYILYLYFNEIVNFESYDNIQLKVEDEYLQLKVEDVQSLGTIHKISIIEPNQINKIMDWLKMSKTIQVFLPPNTIADLAGNRNEIDLIHTVFPFIENLIIGVDWKNKYLSPNNDGISDTLSATIVLNPKTPNKILFRSVVVNKTGQVMLRVNDILDISTGNNIIKLFDNGKYTLHISGSDSNRIVYFNFIWFPETIEEGKYKISFYVQEFWEYGIGLNVGSLPDTSSIYIDITPPEIIRITPVAGDNNQYIDIQPDFVFTLDKNRENSPIKEAYLHFSEALQDDIPFDEIKDLFPWKAGEIYRFNCKAYNIKLIPGPLTVTVAFVDSANNETVRKLHYIVVADTVEGIKDIYNFPNPFNPIQGEITNIAFVSRKLNQFKLYIFDMGFNLVYYKEFFPNSPGLSGFRKTIKWDGTNLKGEVVANGVYFARIVSDKYKSPILKIVVNNK